ncbi:hypothetical protein [Magnetospirillum moscoviense]|uniref:Uncharacterized protein n=1 Tax=Magnetospirillum moscoviense TaxID=1437059 RepID=A0A178MPF4_9PROT|nr:hypothetical protein [Magnetospirillum moscoviense]OAN50692.1 hypothetical protein A6A05_11850 [Magnetospirillum moscoviense]
MAYLSKNLSVLSSANAFTMWHYTTTDTAATVDTEGYFNQASGMLRVGDFIVANVDTDGTPAHGLFVVLSNAAGVVDVGDMVAVGGTDTD